MPTPPSPESQRFFKLLADGQWHPYAEIRDRLATTIGPGKALRFYDERLKYRRLYHGREEDAQDVALSEDDRIFYGQRGLAERSMIAWKRRAVEMTGEGESKMIRRTPGYSVWGIPDVGQSEPSQGGDADAAAEPESAQNAPEVLQVPLAPVAALAALAAPEAAAHQHGCTPSCSLEVGEAEPGEWLPSVFDIERVDEPVAEPEPTESALPQDESEKRPDMALFNESEVRDIVRGEVEKALDAFQVGMEQYLRNQFAQLEGTIAAVAGMPWRAAGGQVRKRH